VRRALLAAGLLVGLAFTGGAARADDALTSDPRAVHVVTSDIARFWQAYDAAQRAPDPALVYGTTYFAPGSDGLWGFVPGRLQSPRHLAEVVQRRNAFYAAAREPMLRIAAQRPRIEDDLVRYKALVPDAEFPDVYVVVGALNSAGTSVSGVGLVLGAEMFAKPSDPAALAGMSASTAGVLKTPDAVPAVVAHELTHYNQHDARARTLLDSTIVEGSADFVAQLVDGHNVDPAQWSFGCAHEDALWREFAPAMTSTDGTTIGAWLFTFEPGPLGAPPFIGYWLGSRIAQSYYDAHADKVAAVHAILNVDDYAAFLKESGYPEHRPRCAPEARYEAPKRR
jgi:Predicted Zn-dependent protease (DUF2268)